MRSATRALERLLVPLVILIAAIGVAAPGPGRLLDRAGAINPTLAVLVLTSGLSLDLTDLRGIRVGKARLALTFVASSSVLPLLAWALSRAATGEIRNGLLAAGVAPSEVASVALTGLAGGEITVAAGLLIASSLVSVVSAGPVLTLLTPGGDPHPLALLATLALVVALPLGIGAVASGPIRRRQGVADLVDPIGLVALLILLWEVASQVRLGSGYLTATGLLAGFVAAGAGLGWLLARQLEPAARPGLVLPVAMRDFAVAAGIATAAFGPASAGALGIYGLLVLLFGTLSARRWRSGRALRSRS